MPSSSFILVCMDPTCGCQPDKPCKTCAAELQFAHAKQELLFYNMPGSMGFCNLVAGLGVQNCTFQNLRSNTALPLGPGDVACLQAGLRESLGYPWHERLYFLAYLVACSLPLFQTRDPGLYLLPPSKLPAAAQLAELQARTDQSAWQAYSRQQGLVEKNKPARVAMLRHEAQVAADLRNARRPVPAAGLRALAALAPAALQALAAAVKEKTRPVIPGAPRAAVERRCSPVPTGVKRRPRENPVDRERPSRSPENRRERGPAARERPSRSPKNRRDHSPAGRKRPSRSPKNRRDHSPAGRRRPSRSPVPVGRKRGR